MKLHKFFDKPEKWIKGWLGSTRKVKKDHYPPKNAEFIHPSGNGEAKSFCILGAIDEINKKSYSTIARNEVCKKLGFTDAYRLAAWNNNPELTFEEFHKRLVEADV